MNVPAPIRHGLILAFFLVLSFVCLVCTTHGQSETASTTAIKSTGGQSLKDVIKAWSARQASTKTLKFEYSETWIEFRTVRKGKKTEAVEATAAGIGLFCTDAKGRVRLQSTEVSNNVEEVFDGKHTKVLQHRNTKKDSSHPLLTVNTPKNGVPSTCKHVRCEAFRIVFRPFDATMGIARSADALELIGIDENVNGKRCVIVQADHWQIWADADRDYIPVRCYLTLNNVTTRKLEIEYQRDDVHGWVPERWKDEWTDIFTYEGKVTHFAINEEVPEEMFDIKPPFGTVVHDNVTKNWYIDREKDKRPVTLKQLGDVGYDKLLVTDPESPWWSSWLTMIAVPVLIFSMGLAFAKWKRRNRQCGK